MVLCDDEANSPTESGIKTNERRGRPESGEDHNCENEDSGVIIAKEISVLSQEVIHLKDAEVSMSLAPPSKKNKKTFIPKEKYEYGVR